MKSYEKPYIMDEEIEVEDICLTSGGDGEPIQSEYSKWFVQK